MYVDLQQFAAILFRQIPRFSTLMAISEGTPWKIAENRTLKRSSSPPPRRGGNLAGHKRPHLQSIYRLKRFSALAIGEPEGYVRLIIAEPHDEIRFCL